MIMSVTHEAHTGEKHLRNTFYLEVFMHLSPFHIGNHTAKYPIVQGGMGIGVSRSRLAGSVALAGGIGILSTAQIGWDEPGWEDAPIETNLKAIHKHVLLAREISQTNGPCTGLIGVNIMVATKQYERYVLASCEAGVDVIISGAGLPIELPRLVAPYRDRTKIAPIVSSAKSADVLLKLWHRKWHTIPDFLIIEGPKAGGHLGFSPDYLKNLEMHSYDNEILAIIPIIKEYEALYHTPIPVIIAGGIFDKLDIQHALSLGATGVQIATPFVVTEECDAHPAYKNAYLQAKEEDIVIIQSPVGMPGRAINNTFLKQVKENSLSISRCYQCLERCNPAKTPYCITNALINAVKGNVDEGLLFCGTNVSRLTEMTTVPKLFDAWTQE